MKIIVADKAEDHLVEESQSKLKGVYGKIGISVRDRTEIICGKLSGGIVDRSAIGDGAVFGKADPKETGSKYPETGKNK
jgi:hypothetical protein